MNIELTPRYVLWERAFLAALTGGAGQSYSVTFVVRKATEIADRAVEAAVQKAQDIHAAKP